jgi:hypothetical protein
MKIYLSAIDNVESLTRAVDETEVANISLSYYDLSGQSKVSTRKEFFDKLVNRKLDTEHHKFRLEE